MHTKALTLLLACAALSGCGTPAIVVTTYYGNDRIKERYGTADSVRTRQSLRFHDDGSPQQEAFYDNGKVTRKVTEWYREGRKRSEEEVRDGRSHGKGLGWYEKADPSEVFEYKDGKLNGKLIQWDIKGNKTRDLEFRDGEKTK